MEDFFLKLDNLFGYIPGTDRQQEFTLFTKVDTNQNLMNLCASDGDDLFTKVILEEDLDSMARECGCASKEDFLDKICACITKNTFSIMNHNDHVIVQFEKEISSSFSLKLFSTTASERKQLLKYAYLQVAQQMQNFKLKISALEKELEEEKQKTGATPTQHEAPTSSSIFEPEFKRAKQIKPKVMKGGSLINPGSRRKKAASGVVFDDD